ncbi:hypothetical protein KIPB_002539 [Kipferlia bialata]|uniref:Uncharacterized protein n=1 Tax=Kipferlia bialata TaxID=797122 RepID=A0A9K3CSD6_9EUKA|nr:hypothetical protein KIPB_002539 [Kipferlia bialata]|eukprot:g2539.t1
MPILMNIEAASLMLTPGPYSTVPSTLSAFTFSRHFSRALFLLCLPMERGSGEGEALGEGERDNLVQMEEKLDKDIAMLSKRHKRAHESMDAYDPSKTLDVL